MFYTGQLLTLFVLHFEDENVCGLFNLQSGSSKMWYIIPPSLRKMLKTLTALDKYNVGYLTGLKAEARMDMILNSTVMESCIIKKQCESTKV